MQQQLEEHPNFSNIQDNPIELLNTIQLLIYDPVRVQYPLASMTDALVRLINIKQGVNEILVDYVKRFKQARDVMKSYLGIKVLDEFIENSNEYQSETDVNKQQELKDAALEKLFAFLFLNGSDHSKYGTLINGLKTQFSLGNDQYPKTITAAIDALSDHRFDQQYYTNRDKCRWNHHQQQQ